VAGLSKPIKVRWISMPDTVELMIERLTILPRQMLRDASGGKRN